MILYSEITIVGAGPAGLEAAIAAAEAGADVVLVDEAPQPGGQYFRQPSPAHQPDTDEPDPTRQQAEALFARLEQTGVRLLPETLVWGAFPAPDDGDWLLMLHGQAGYRQIQSPAVILAPGAFDRPVAFPGWTLPGVMTAGGVQNLLKVHHALPGRRFVLAGAGPLQLTLAAQLMQAGAEVIAVLEAAQPFGWRGLKHAGALLGQWSRLTEGRDYLRVLRDAGVSYRTGWGVVAAHGESEVEEVEIAQLAGDWHPLPGTQETLAADTLVLGYGFIPATQLSRLLGCQHHFRPKMGGWVPLRDDQMQTSLPGVFAVGDCAGSGGAGLARVEGRIAGLAAARQVGRLDVAAARQAIDSAQSDLLRERRFAQMMGDLFTPGPGLYALPDDSTLICRCEEVTLADIHAALAVGAESVNEVKGLTRCGMGNCQGRTCGDLLARIIATENNRNSDYAKNIEAAGQFTVRAPLHPLPLSILARAADEL